VTELELLSGIIFGGGGVAAAAKFDMRRNTFLDFDM